MFDLLYKLSGFTSLEMRSDPIIRLFTAISASDKMSRSAVYQSYAGIVAILLREDVSLAEYLRKAAVKSDSPVLLSLASTENPDQDARFRYSALKYDVYLLKSLSEIDSKTLKSTISERMDDSDFNLLPDYERGNFDYDADYFIDFVKENGSGIFSEYKAVSFRRSDTSNNFDFAAVKHFDPVKLSSLKEYDAQKLQVVANTESFIAGKKAQNVLLYGDRGTGKSSTVKAIVNEYSALRLVEIDKADVGSIIFLYEKLSLLPLKFIIFIDDLTFESNDGNYHVLKQALEGSAAVMPDNVLIYATTNRRHLVKETSSDRDRDSFHRGDSLDDNVSLSDRFGLFLTFSLPGKDLYLNIARQIADERGIIIEKAALEAAAEQFAIKKGGRSPRIAKQCIDFLSVNANVNNRQKEC